MAHTAAEKDRELARRILYTGQPSTPEQWSVRRSIIEDGGATTLRRAQMTLHRWSELECGTGDGQHTWSIERDEVTGEPLLRHQRPGYGGKWLDTSAPCPDREAGALRRVEQVCKEAGLTWYYQRDPRGCALYVGTEELTDSNYSQKGIACL